MVFLYNSIENDERVSIIVTEEDIDEDGVANFKSVFNAFYAGKDRGRREHMLV